MLGGRCGRGREGEEVVSVSLWVSLMVIAIVRGKWVRATHSKT